MCNVRWLRHPFIIDVGRTLSALLLLALTACGGDDSASSPSGDASVATVREGVFLDSSVAGLRYETATLSGLTDAAGGFRYRAGETVAFFLQNLPLGQAPGAAVLTPVELTPGAQDELQPQVTNLCILLQSLDEDGDPANGINLSVAVRQMLDGQALNLEQSTEQFLQDPELTGLLEDLNTAGVFTSSGSRNLPSAEEARQHLRTTLNDLDRDGDGYSPNQGDCDDADANAYPGGPEACGDGGNQGCSDGVPGCPSAETDFDSQLRQLISSYRSQNGLAPLAFDTHLHDLALEHSQNMQDTGVMSHDGFTERFNRSGFRTCVENVGWNYTTPEAMFEGWRNSPGHNTNMLNQRIGWAGVSRVGSYITFFACGN